MNNILFTKVKLVMPIERRGMQYKTFKLESKNINEIKGIFTGYAATFGNVDRVGDKIMPNAFDKSVELWSKGLKIVKALFEHDDWYLLNHTVNKLENDGHGLITEIQITDEFKAYNNEYYVRLIDLAKQNRLFMSIGYNIVKSRYENNVQILEEIDLVEISLVSNPANWEATVFNVKSNPINIKSDVAKFAKVSEISEYYRKNLKTQILSNSDIDIILKTAYELGVKHACSNQTQNQKTSHGLETIKTSIGLASDVLHDTSHNPAPALEQEQTLSKHLEKLGLV